MKNQIFRSAQTSQMIFELEQNATLDNALQCQLKLQQLSEELYQQLELKVKSIESTKELLSQKLGYALDQSFIDKNPESELTKKFLARRLLVDKYQELTMDRIRIGAIASDLASLSSIISRSLHDACNKTDFDELVVDRLTPYFKGSVMGALSDQQQKVVYYIIGGKKETYSAAEISEISFLPLTTVSSIFSKLKKMGLLTQSGSLYSINHQKFPYFKQRGRVRYNLRRI